MLSCENENSSGANEEQVKRDTDVDDFITPGLMMYASDDSENYFANCGATPMKSETSTVKTSTATSEALDCIGSRKRNSLNPLKEPTFDYMSRETSQLTLSEQDHINVEAFNDSNWKILNKSAPPYMYENQSGLDYSTQFNTFNASDQDACFQTDTNGITVLKCSECPKTFRTMQQLRQHMLVHSNIRKHSCRFCDKTFKQQCHLQQHERLHTGELPYKCHIGTCNKAFRQSSNLKLHVKMHISYLNKEFSQSAPRAMMSASSPDLAYGEKDYSESPGMPDLLSSCLLQPTSVQSTKYDSLQKQQSPGTTTHHSRNNSVALASSLSSHRSVVSSKSPSSSISAYKSTHSLSSKIAESINVTSSSWMNSAHAARNKSILPTSELFQNLASSSTVQEVCTPVHQQSLMSLSRKLYEISQRKEFQFLNADRQSRSPFKHL